MTNFIPIFPLEIVVYPGEQLNLHIFEPRYKELVKECLRDDKPFGLPPVIDNKLAEHGTLMEVVELVRLYDNGEMDIKTRGLDIFRILEVVKEIPDKLYSGAIVTYPDNVREPEDSRIAKQILEEVKRLYTLLNVENKFPAEKEFPVSYEIAHFVGMSRQQEYELLELFTEIHRLEYLRRHLNHILPVVKELEAMKARVKMNGHFRNLDTGDFNL